MADIKRKFRGNGLDAAGEKVINVGTADRTVMSDGVNVDFLIQENTIQQYDENRTYSKNFAVIYDNRIWVSNRDITEADKGPFNEQHWDAVRTDAKWTTISSGSHTLTSGAFISADTKNRTDMSFTLPSDPQDGDTIFVKDIGGFPGFGEVKINASVQSIMVPGYTAGQRSVKMTHPYSQMVFVFSNRLWNLYISDYENKSVFVNGGQVYEAQANDKIVRRYTTGEKITVKLPKHANHGDVINFTDLDGLNPLYHMIVNTFDANTSIGEVGKHSIESRTAGDGFIVFDSSENLWRVWDGDLRTRLRIVRTDTNLRPNEHIMVFGVDNATPGVIELNLPEDVAIGDTVKISLDYIRKGQTVNINASGTDTIASDIKLLQFPKRSEYPPDAEWVQVKTLSFNGDSSYVPVLELSYIDDRDTNKQYWVVAQAVITVERVDSKDAKTRARVGVIALATQDQANKDHEDSPAKELAITPETLANRVATKLRRGIARLVKPTEMNINTTDIHLDDVIVTPKDFNDRFATETRRGVAEIATQVETNTGTDDSTIITPLKLAARKASEILTGILALVTTGATTKPGTTRDEIGTNIYNNLDNEKAVTPKSLFENKATANAQGQVYLATANEVINGTPHTFTVPTVVTPVELHKKTATTSRIGFVQTATQVEVDAGIDKLKYVTPETFNGRIAREDLTGIARYATTNEFAAGNSKLISEPSKIKAYFEGNRISTVSESGLIESGNIWNHYTLDISKATETQRGTSEIATQIEVDTGLDDERIVTAKKLQAKKASETTEGIIEVADESETITGTILNKAVAPKHLKHVIQIEPTWQATPILRGPVKISEGAITFIGNETVGSTAGLESYEKNGYAISPYELNKTLVNFLPKKAKAVDSDKLDGLDSLQFVRRDIDQTVTGSLTLTKQTQMQAPVVSTSTAKFTQVHATTDMTIGDDTAHSVINLNAKGNHWLVDAQADTQYLDFTADADVLRLNRNGNVDVGQTLSAGNKIDASKGFSVQGGTMIINPTATEVIIGTQSKKVSLHTQDAKQLSITDPTGTYNILNTSNAVDIVGQNFVKKSGDSMIGDLNIAATLNVVINQSLIASATAKPVARTANSWTAEITTKSLYEQFPGFMVPTFDPASPKAVAKYEEVKGPGLLSQFGTGTTNVYQIWAPRPPVGDVNTNHTAKTFWIRNFNIVTGEWDKFGRMFTSEQPPTAADIGAVSVGNAEFANLTIRDWLQIGNVRMYPNAADRSVDFEWIE